MRFFVVFDPGECRRLRAEGTGKNRLPFKMSSFRNVDFPAFTRPITASVSFLSSLLNFSSFFWKSACIRSILSASFSSMQEAISSLMRARFLPMFSTSASCCCVDLNCTAMMSLLIFHSIWTAIHGRAVSRSRHYRAGHFLFHSIGSAGFSIFPSGWDRHEPSSPS